MKSLSSAKTMNILLMVSKSLSCIFIHTRSAWNGKKDSFPDRRHEVEYHKADAHLFNVDIENIKMESKCEACGMQFASEEIVKFHFKFVHINKHVNSTVENKHFVEANNFEPTKKDPGETVTFSLDNQIGKFICSACGTRIKDKWKMKRHIRNNHNVQTTWV